MHARRIRPNAGALDRRRLTAAGLSALLPGLGQLFNGRRTLGLIFLVPSLVVLLVFVALWMTNSPTRLAATVADPTVLGTLLTLNLILMVWRLLAAGQAFLDTRWHGPTGRGGLIGIVIIGLLIVVPHLALQVYGRAFGVTFERVFEPIGQGRDEPGASAPPEERPSLDERVNILLLGVDTRPSNPSKGTRTDTMVVASLDPVGKTVSMVSIPRDLINVPLGNGDVFGPKLNSLMGYAERHPDEFPDGGMQALQDAVGALLGIEVPYYARIDFPGFVKMIDAVGGVDVHVTQGFEDPTYDGNGWDGPGFAITKGVHHLDGGGALAYARARKAAGESDFTRAARQQEILVGLRDAVTSDGSLLWELPGLLDAIGDTVKTNVPRSILPELAVLADEVDDDSVARAVIRHPLVKSRNTQYGSSLDPDLDAILAVAGELFPEPGETPTPWPTPKPSPTPKATPSP